MSAHLHIHSGEAGKPISPRLFGVFYEDLNHAGEGGLYAEMVQNRAFNHPEPLNGWDMLTSAGTEGTMGPYLSPDESVVNRWGLRLRIVAADAGRVGVTNGGYWGMAVAAGCSYRLTLDAWCSEDFRGPLTATLESCTGEVYARAEVNGLSTEKQRLSVILTMEKSDLSDTMGKDAHATARLVVAASTPGTLWFDFISLFPTNTWKGRANGMRADLAEMVAALRPSFMRFPGGCYVEGDRMSEAFRWKENLGDPAQRAGHWNRWGYHSSGGLGLHEYLQFCEDLGAEPLFVVNAGFSHTDSVPEDEIDCWVQDAVDAIDYANGALSSPWGARRAAAGHPEPFHLRFIEIGNENGGPLYERNFARFTRAIKARFPQVHIISNVPIADQPVEIIDQHFFAPPAELASMAGYFDDAERGGAAIYVGEYAACWGDSGIGNLRAALGEAAFMTGLERNGDLVEMASVTPSSSMCATATGRWMPSGSILRGVTARPPIMCSSFSAHTVARHSPHSAARHYRRGFCGAFAGVVGRSAAGEIIIKVVNMSASPRDVRLTLDGAPPAATGTAITLTGDPDAANTLLHPTAVAPISRQLDGVAADFHYTFPSNSLTILHLKD